MPPSLSAPNDSLLIIDPTLSHTDTVSQFYQQLVTAGKSVLEVVQSFLPRTKPARQYINSRCLQLLDQRKSAFQLNLMYSYELLNKEIRGEAKRAKNDFIRTEIEIRKWVGIKYCRAFVPKPIKIQDTAGHFHRIQLRAQILGKYYETTQWHHQPLPPLPDHPLCFQYQTIFPQVSSRVMNFETPPPTSKRIKPLAPMRSQMKFCLSF